MSYRRLRRSELPLDTVALARFLIGKTLVRHRQGVRLAGRIVETEAYLPDDASAHTFRGKTARNQSMYLHRGHAYVYFIYGTWFALNVASGPEGFGAGVLIRAAEPLEGTEQMRRFRPQAKDEDLARGPGKLATVFDIDRRYDGVDLCAAGPLWLGAAVRPVGKIGVSVRIGITKEAHREHRFYEIGNPHVSGPRRFRTVGVVLPA